MQKGLNNNNNMVNNFRDLLRTIYVLRNYIYIYTWADADPVEETS